MTQVATLEAAEAIRGRLERALLQEEVNLASENGRGLRSVYAPMIGCRSEAVI